MVPRPDQIPDAHESYLKFRAKMRRKHGLPSVPRDVESGGELLDEVLEPDPSPEKGADSEVKKKEEA